MNVLVMVSRDPQNPGFGGGELVLFSWAEFLAQRGAEVHVLCAGFRGAPREAMLNGVHVVRVGPESTLGFTAFVEYQRRFRARIDLVLEDMLGGARLPFAAPLYVREPVVSVWFQDHLPLFQRQFPAVLLPALAGLERLIVFVHRGTSILAPSEASRQSYVRKGGSADRVTVFHPGVPSELLAGERALAARDRQPRVLFLGKLRRYKCPDLAIRAFGLVARDLPQSSMVVAGRPDEERFFEELRELTHSLGLDTRVTFERGISEARKLELLRTSRVLLSPAPVEGFGIAGLEASACGLPVVGTTGTPEEALQEGVNGFRVPFGEVSAMAGRARDLLRDDALFDRVSGTAVRFAQAFTPSAAIQPLEELMHKLDRPKE